MSPPAGAPLPEDEQRHVMAVLRRVADPELAESITDLGLVQSLGRDGETLQVRLLPTSATCPMADLLVDEVAAALAPLYPSVEVSLDWDGQWTPERMTPALRQRLGW
jgi:metal-sulfur cluster biosynthetic enzyme